jgi:hypothetical protein
MAKIGRVHWSVGHSENQSARYRKLGQSVRIQCGVQRPLGKCLVTRFGDEFDELGVRDGASLHPEAIHANIVRGPFLLVMNI